MSANHVNVVVVIAFIALATLAVLLGGRKLQSRKIQPGTFRWANLRRELRVGLLNLAITTATITVGITWLKANGWIRFQAGPAHWPMLLGEYALSFFLFDTYFYWAHRAMHVEPWYRWIHKVHHRSTAPVPVTSWAMSPIEGVIEGLFTPLFLLAIPVHEAVVPFIAPTSVLMGLYVHSGFELLPRWWNRTWLTKWFIPASFHDEHHHYFTGNFGGYTTVWDRLCGTMRPKFEANFDKVVARSRMLNAGPER
jgi:sterol desaturase/sphingolipid hydroxylase (fatty acid hydroxylase superfamily)